MAKKGKVERERNVQKLSRKYFKNRTQYKKDFYHRKSLRERLRIHSEIQKLPRNSSLTRLHNRCQFSGRSRGYYRSFGLSRHFFRELTYLGVLPGVRKSSW